MKKNSIETLCPICKAIVRVRRIGVISEHRIEGIICRGSGKTIATGRMKDE